MDRPAQPTPDLGMAARAATLVAYLLGVTGAGVGTAALRAGDPTSAILVWMTTVAVGATLVGVATLLRALRTTQTRITGIEHELQRLRGVERYGD
jgi:uncharacterized membrane protein